MRSRARSVVLLLAALVSLPTMAAGQSPSPSHPTSPTSAPTDGTTVLIEPVAGTVPVRFSVVGPLSPDDTRLVLLTGERSCGAGATDQLWSAAHVAETDESISLRLDAVVGPHGRPCRSDTLVRVPVELAAPLGDRVIEDVRTDPATTPYVNPLDPVDTGFAYICDGRPSRIADLVGPGLDVSDHGPPSLISGARAIVDEGDFIEYLGPLGRRGGDSESWWHGDDGWERVSWGACRPRAVLSPGLEAADWSLRGPAPGANARRVKVWVDGASCAGGRSPAGRIARPIVQVRRDSIIVIIGVEPLRGVQDCQGTPPAPFVIELPVRLGDRTLYDGGVYPPRERSGR